MVTTGRASSFGECEEFSDHVHILESGINKTDFTWNNTSGNFTPVTFWIQGFFLHNGVTSSLKHGIWKLLLPLMSHVRIQPHGARSHRSITNGTSLPPGGRKWSCCRHSDATFTVTVQCADESLPAVTTDTTMTATHQPPRLMSRKGEPTCVYSRKFSVTFTASECWKKYRPRFSGHCSCLNKD